MKRLSLLSTLLVLFVAGEDLYAQTFSVQGVLRDPMGRTVDDGSYNLTFKIYNVETGGSELWSENQASVSVQHGVFGVELGVVTALSGLTFGEPYWLGVTVVGGAEMTPRFKLAANPHSLSVMGAENRMPSKGNVGIGTTNPADKLHIQGGHLRIEGDTHGLIMGYGGQNKIMPSVTGYDELQMTFYVHEDGMFYLRRNHNSTVNRAFFNSWVGITTEEPHALLSLGGTVADQKMLVYDVGNSRYGFGIASGELRTFAASGGHLSFGHVADSDGTTWSEKMRMDANGRLGIGTATPQESLSIAGMGAALELGAGVADKEGNAGKIAYRKFSDALDILGGGPNNERHIKFWAEHGSVFTGRVGIGITTPEFGLDVEAANGYAVGKFGASLPVYIHNNWPAIGFNASATDVWRLGKGSAPAFGGSLGLNPGTGDFTFSSGTAAGNAGEAFTNRDVLRIEQDGDLKLLVGAVEFSDGSRLASANLGGTASGVNNTAGDAVISASGSVLVEKFLAARGGMVDISNPADPVTSVGLNLGNQNGKWHFSGPRSYEAGNNLSIYWTPDGAAYHRRLMITDGGFVGINNDNPETQLDVNGAIINRGMDFILGKGDLSRGDSGMSRALVKDNGNILHVNYAGDFTGGTMLGGGQVYVPGNLIVGSNTNNTQGLIMGYGGQYKILPSIPGNDDMQMTFYVHDDPVFYLRRNYNSAVDYAYFDGKVGIGTESPQENLAIAGMGAALELGAGVADKEFNAGKIAYRKFSDALDILGGGSNNERRIKFWAEHGAYFNGSVGIHTESPSTDLMVGNVATKTSDSFITLASDGGSLYRQGIRMIHHGEGDANQFGSYMMASDVDDNLHIGSYFSGPTEIDRMVIRNDNGNVGIGTSAPAHKLHIYTGRLAMDAPIAEQSGMSFLADGVESAVLYRYQGTNNISLWGSGVGRDIMTWNTTTGNIGIGTTGPNLPLHVVAQANVSVNNYGFLNSAGAVGGGGNAPSVGVSIWADGRVVCSEFNAVSDERIKRIIGSSDGRADLEIFRQLDVTNYTFIDSVARGSGVQKKLIAQQVQKAYPEAVSATEGFIPSVYEMSAEVVFDDENQQLTICMASEHELVAGDMVRLIEADGSRNVEVLAVIDERTFAVAGTEAEQMFVFGKQVDDFLAIDYEAISMLNVSVTQQLLGRIELLEEQVRGVEALKLENAELRAEMARFGAALERFEVMMQGKDNGSVQRAEFRVQTAESEIGDSAESGGSE
jgi:hypothetical protein